MEIRIKEPIKNDGKNIISMLDFLGFKLKKGEFMNNLDYIKWLIGQAEGFTLNGDQLIFPEGGIESLTEELIELPVWKLVWFPLLIFKASQSIGLLFPENELNTSLEFMYSNRTWRKV